MPTTPNGTTYTVTTATLPNGDQAAFAVANALATTAEKLVVYTHGNNGSYDQFASLSAWSGIRNWLIDNGWAWVESSGAGDDWGGSASRTSYQQAVAWARTIIPGHQVAVLARSMGGLTGYWLAAFSNFAADTVGLIVNSGTTDLTERYSVAVGEDLAEMNAAYGIPGTGRDTGAFAQASAGHDPMLFPLSAWAGKSVLQMWGSADTTVPPDTHAKAWVAKYGGAVRYLATDERAGGDHSGNNGSYLQVAAMTNFLAHVSEAKPESRPVLRIAEMFAVGWDRRLYPVLPG